ncbi:hypothetical protein [Streptomyces sp. NPDC056707]|uniref:hypothetical protein n=1 Tax=Streptomyces sp. NPDC056707 TaxID=3345919 RepID=UPI0036C89A52
MQPGRDQIIEHLKDHDGIARVTMAWLRKCYNPKWERLSRGRAEEIAGWFEQNGVLHDSTHLPRRETERVTLYLINSSIGHVVAAARQTGPYKGNPVMASLMLQQYAKQLTAQAW